MGPLIATDVVTLHRWFAFPRINRTWFPNSLSLRPHPLVDTLCEILYNHAD